MDDGNPAAGLTVLCGGLLASAASSFLEHLAVLGTAASLAAGFCDGLAAVAFGAAIFLLARRRPPTRA